MKNGKETVSTTMDWQRILLGAGISTLIILLTASAIAGLVSRSFLERNWMDKLAALSLITAGFVGGRIAGGSIGRKKESWVSYGLGWLILLIIQMILFEPNLKGAAFTALAMGGGCGASHLMGQRKTGYSRRRKYGYR